jgi:hypothetical protein
MDLKELVHKANQLVQKEGHTLQELLEKNDFPGNANAIIEVIKDNEFLIDTPTDEDYDGLSKALAKRREISLKATYAAVSHILLPTKFPLKSLDNFKGNLQSEKNKPKEILMPESEELSQEDIEALLAGNITESKDKKASADDQLSNDDIEALLAGIGPSKPPTKEHEKEDISQDEIELLLASTGNISKPSAASAPAKAQKEQEELSQDDIEALLAGEPKTQKASPAPAKAKEDDFDLSDEAMNKLLSGGESHGEDSEQISEDDIQSLLEAQVEQDNKNPLAMALNLEESALLRTKKPNNNTDRMTPKQPELEPAPAPIEFTAEETNLPQDIFPPSKSLEELLVENDIEESIGNVQPEPEIPEPVKAKASTSSKIETKPIIQEKSASRVSVKHQNPANENIDEILRGGDIKERVLSDVYALYVNKAGKPSLHAECATRDDVKKAYLLAMQNFPQNSLFIEKISRKEIIVVKETKEIINLKVNISFD